MREVDIGEERERPLVGMAEERDTPTSRVINGRLRAMVDREVVSGNGRWLFLLDEKQSEQRGHSIV
jgi:hypothetical protein